jgi:hypothetical protein
MVIVISTNINGLKEIDSSHSFVLEFDAASLRGVRAPSDDVYTYAVICYYQLGLYRHDVPVVPILSVGMKYD